MTPQVSSIPDAPQPTPEMTAYVYGCELLLYVMQQPRPLCYGNLSDDALAALEHSAHSAVTAPGILPVAVDTISAIRHEVYKVQQWRKARTAQPDHQEQAGSSQPAGRNPPNEGPMAKLIDRPIANPPAGQRVAIGDFF